MRQKEGKGKMVIVTMGSVCSSVVYNANRQAISEMQKDLKAVLVFNPISRLRFGYSFPSRMNDKRFKPK